MTIETDRHFGPVASIVLAGGLARRMGGGDKALTSLAGRPLLDRVLARIQPQAAHVAINANGDAARFARWSLPVVPDTIDGNPGPLAGVLAGLDWAATLQPRPRWLLSVPADAPFLPTDLIERLEESVSATKTEMACAWSGGRTHWVIALWPLAMREALRAAMIDEHLRKVEDWVERHRFALAEWRDDPLDPFLNVNTKDDLAAAERVLSAR
jgi:molybdopterin-guanine dinucleotide biosynthesis protein A